MTNYADIAMFGGITVFLLGWAVVPIDRVLPGRCALLAFAAFVFAAAVMYGSGQWGR